MGKYEKGEVIKSLDELAKQDFIYWDHKVYHWAWIHSMQFRALLLALTKNEIRYAIRKVESKNE